MTNQIETHQNIDPSLCGHPLELKPEYSRFELKISDNMVVDDFQLTHGGFVFGLADYAVMIAVNHPNVVLGSSEVTFLKPVKRGESVIAKAKVIEKQGKKISSMSKSSEEKKRLANHVLK